jgi:hypothetical protein
MKRSRSRERATPHILPAMGMKPVVETRRALDRWGPCGGSPDLR